MTDNDRLVRRAITLLVMAAVLLSSSSWAVGDESSDSMGLVLDIYVDDAGKALVTGYAKSIEGLPFLNASEYQYDEDANQLYAVTNALTMKNGDDWEIGLPAEGVYAEYHVTFYLTANVQLSNITGTEGLDYLVSSSSESFVVEFHGYDVASPTATVQYRQSVGDEGLDPQAASLQPTTSEDSSTFTLALAGVIIIALVAVSALKFRRQDKTAPPPGETPSVSSASSASSASSESSVSEAVEAVPEYIEAGVEAVGEDEADLSQAAPPVASPPVQPSISPAEGTGEVSISVEMVAVMETLTERERSVLEALIKHEGKMTQADIRYETGIPKSSLTGIIVSLERRNIVTKKEWGRTNVIELTERLTQGGR